MAMKKMSKCGDHGTADEYNICRCTNHWSGTYCTDPPPANFPCVKSDANFRAQHNGGDLDCGNNGVYGACQDGGTCSCIGTGRFGSHCTVECEKDTDCGGGALPNQRQGKGTCRNQVCQCMNGWSGFQCRTPPEDGKCLFDGDCGFGDAVNGKCISNKCVCTNQSADEENPLLYTGSFCEKPQPSADGGKSSPAEWKEHMEQIIQSVLSDTTLYYMGVEKLGSFAAKKALTAAASLYLKQQLSKKLGQEGTELVTQEAAAALAKMLPEKAAAKLMVDIAARQAATASMDELATVGAEAAVEAAFPPLGWILMLANVLQVFGLILDTIDVRGLNEQMMQSVLDQYKVQYQRAVNDSDDATKYNLRFPRPYSPTETAEFQAALASKPVQDQIIQDAAEYLSSLTVNSAGEIIRPFFASLAQAEMDAKKTKYAVYWSMSRGNVDVFNRLIKYGWMIWVFSALLILAIVLTCVLTSPAVRARLRK